MFIKIIYLNVTSINYFNLISALQRLCLVSNFQKYYSRITLKKLVLSNCASGAVKIKKKLNVVNRLI